MIHQFNPLYYQTLDEIFHSHWATKKYARFAIIRKVIKEIFPKGIKTKLIQVGGTSGKGSVCKFLEAGLSLVGSAGTQTSPHLYDWRERFSVNGQSPTQQNIIEIWETLKKISLRLKLNDDKSLSFSEINLLTALILWEKYQVGWGMVEVGIGGRYDISSVLDYQASVLTTVDEDHQKLLGETIWQRALDKAGIIQKNKPIFTTVSDPEVLKFVEFIAQSCKSKLFEISDLNQVANFAKKLDKNNILANSYQQKNAALALKVIKYFYPKLADEKILQKFSQVKFAGRFEQISEGIYLDIAHNKEKVANLSQELLEKFPDKNLLFIVGLSKERTAQEVFAPIMKIAKKIIITSTPYKGVEPELIKQELKVINYGRIPIKIIAEPKEALNWAKNIKLKNKIIILTGSTYMISDIFNPDPYIRQLNSSRGWRDPVESL